ncbi:MAG TPA: 2,3-bisphosphoglycerate-independent phosphoglycerate mutase [Planctomycetota bacterium]|nr:2,3-bisphosphoglycerate-independent phosphoglycerate mutase [Planctomycetota bacterium]
MPAIPPRKGPVMLIVKDGWGLRDDKTHNAVKLAKTPNYDTLSKSYPFTTLITCGTDVGLPKGTMGNSEVGHLNLGAGRVVWQDLMEVAQAIVDGTFDTNPVILNAINHAKKNNSRLHLFGLISAARVHSVDEVYFALVRLCARHDLRKDRLVIHVFTDGRDTAPKSGEGYVGELQRKLDLYDTGIIATVTGRYFGMDRDKRWERVEKAWKAMVDGEGECTAASAAEAIQKAYERGETDEFIKATVIVDEAGKPLATIKDGDAVLSFNHRSDRPRELCEVLLNKDFKGFARKHQPKVHLATLTDYRAGFDAPIAFPSKPLEGGLGEIAAAAGLKQLRMAETEKYPHVTFFFSGGREEPFNGEERIMAPSPKKLADGTEVKTYDQIPEMSAPELTKKAADAIRSKKFDLIILNYANGDMVGHTGDEKAAIAAIETVDKGVGELVQAIREVNGEVLITADHGNAEQMWDDANNCPHTAHTTNNVPCYLVSERFKSAKLKPGRLADVAPTLAFLLGIEKSPQMKGENLIV